MDKIDWKEEERLADIEDAVEFAARRAEAAERGILLVDLNDPSQTGGGHWLAEQAREKEAFARAVAEGRCEITIERPESSKRTPFGDSIDGWGFGIVLNFWDYWAFAAGGVETRVDIPLRGEGPAYILPLMHRLSRAGLRERIGRERLCVVVWDDGETVHVEGERGSVETIAREVRAAIEGVVQ